jgi:mRNA-degrading endonuclease RelE of RelBE toxin-antitoxin system
MKILFERKFLKDIDVLNDKDLKLKIEQIIIEIENSKNFNNFLHLKKLKGNKTAYRIRVGEYRLGTVTK